VVTTTTTATTTSTERPTTSRFTAGDVWLARAAGVFTAAVLLHGSDHLRRGIDSIHRDVFWLGTSGVLIEVGVVLVICARHRLAPLVAALVGGLLASGYVVVHFLPARSFFSDSFLGHHHTSPLSWIAASLEVATAGALAITGLVVLVQRGGCATLHDENPGRRSWRDSFAHPIVVAMIAGNAVILAVSFASL
jgi:hypothetical protein